MRPIETNLVKGRPFYNSSCRPKNCIHVKKSNLIEKLKKQQTSGKGVGGWSSYHHLLLISLWPRKFGPSHSPPIKRKPWSYFFLMSGILETKHRDTSLREVYQVPMLSRLTWYKNNNSLTPITEFRIRFIIAIAIKTLVVFRLKWCIGTSTKGKKEVSSSNKGKQRPAFKCSTGMKHYPECKACASSFQKKH